MNAFTGILILSGLMLAQVQGAYADTDHEPKTTEAFVEVEIFQPNFKRIEPLPTVLGWPPKPYIAADSVKVERPKIEADDEYSRELLKQIFMLNPRKKGDLATGLISRQAEFEFRKHNADQLSRIGIWLLSHQAEDAGPDEFVNLMDDMVRLVQKGCDTEPQLFISSMLPNSIKGVAQALNLNMDKDGALERASFLAEKFRSLSYLGNTHEVSTRDGVEKTGFDPNKIKCPVKVKAMNEGEDTLYVSHEDRISVEALATDIKKQGADQVAE